jgi:phosphohistidine phosphatase SixA
MLHLLLFRHATAHPRAEAPDAQRPLSPQGVAEARALMAAVVARGWIPQLGLASPYLRTRQTLDCLQEATQAAGKGTFPVEVWPGCCPESSPRAALEHCEAMEEAHVVAMVSHEPFTGEFVQEATGKARRFRPCDLAVLAWNGRRWRLEEELSGRDLVRS